MTDGTFLRSFSLMVFLLIILAVVLAMLGLLVASDVDGRLTEEKQIQKDRIIAKRIAPAGTLAIGEQTATPAASAADSGGAGAAVVAEGGEVSGEGVYSMSCALCHAQGVGGAPIVGNSKAWAERITRGMELLIERANSGYQGSAGYMPPKGGNPTLSDAQIAAAVEYMVGQSQ